MAGTKPSNESDEKRFNQTLKRMLKTPPKPHEKAVKEESTNGKSPVDKAVPKKDS
ncbi:hypothetical protein [Mesorhizobium sp.]|uniref:hypothetical protein n=1 Tax=Mesorhizobium sp. TaxID=1871066 RepID=UPI0025D41D3F|nr:hypothetical protein [Mesorhizobium sp.]